MVVVCYALSCPYEPTTRSCVHTTSFVLTIPCPHCHHAFTCKWMVLDLDFPSLVDFQTFRLIFTCTAKVLLKIWLYSIIYKLFVERCYKCYYKYTCVIQQKYDNIFPNISLRCFAVRICD